MPADLYVHFTHLIGKVPGLFDSQIKKIKTVTLCQNINTCTVFNCTFACICDCVPKSHELYVLSFSSTVVLRGVLELELVFEVIYTKSSILIYKIC